MTIRYFVHEDTGRVYACIGSMGMGGIFQFGSRAACPGWEFLAPQSPAWDAVHQRIFRNFDTEAIEPGEWPEPLPPLPEIPAGPFPGPSDYALPSRSIEASGYPRVAEFIRRQGRESITVYAILAEDTYETSQGDGEFHYFREVCFTEEEARHCQPQNEHERLHSRAVTIGLGDGVFLFPEFELKPFDHYRIDNVLAGLEACLTAWPLGEDTGAPTIHHEEEQLSNHSASTRT